MKIDQHCENLNHFATIMFFSNFKRNIDKILVKSLSVGVITMETNSVSSKDLFAEIPFCMCHHLHHMT